MIRCQQTALCTGTEQISKEGKGKGRKTDPVDKKDDDKEDTEKDSGLSKNGTVDEGKKKKTNQTGKGGKDQKNVSDTDIKGADSNKNGSVKVQTEKTTGAGYVLGLLGLGEKEKDSAKKKDLDEGKDKKNVSKTDIEGAGLKKNETLEENVSDTGVKRAKLNKQTVKENQTVKQNQTEKSTSFLGWLGLGSEEEDPAKKKDEGKGQKKNTEKESGLSKNGTAEEGNKEKTNQTEKSSSKPKRLIRFRHAKSAI